MCWHHLPSPGFYFKYTYFTAQTRTYIKNTFYFKARLYFYIVGVKICCSLLIMLFLWLRLPSFLQIFYLVGFAFFCIESLISIWVIQVKSFLGWYLSFHIFSVWLYFELWLYPFFEWCAASLHVLQRKWKSCRNEKGCSKNNYDGSIMTTWQWWWKLISELFNHWLFFSYNFNPRIHQRFISCM